MKDFCLPATSPRWQASYRGSAVATPAQPVRIHEFAEGDTSASPGNPRETLYLANMNPHATQITITMLSTRSRVTRRLMVLPAAGYAAIDMNDWKPRGQHGLIVPSSLPILASRSIDFNESADRLMSSGVTG